MSGSSIQLASFGSQNLFLNNDADITFFKSVWHKYTHFAVEDMENSFQGSVGFGRSWTVDIQKSADLLWKCYLKVTLPAMTQSSGTVNWVRNIGHVLIKDYEIQINGGRCDKRYGEFMTIMKELSMPAEKLAGYDILIGNTAALTTPSASIPAATLYVPLDAWFCRSADLALPLVSLLFSTIRLVFTIRPASECYVTDDGLAPTSGAPEISNAVLKCQYIYLTDAERDRFGGKDQEYLIDQLQVIDQSSASSSVTVNTLFAHPVRELTWVVQPDANVAANVNRWSDFTDGATAYNGGHPVATARITLAGNDRSKEESSTWYGVVLPYQNHTRVPSTGIYNYSYALDPENPTQPSGSMNYSRIDRATLNLTLNTGSSAVKTRVYAVNHNIFRTVSGQGGISYAS
jgi:hypothetical protein